MPYSDPTKKAEYQKSYRERRRVVIAEGKSFYGKTSRGKQTHREAQKKHRRKLRLEMITAYGGKCACCSEANYEFLALDHVNNDGAAHRRALSNSKNNLTLYNDLKKRGWPVGYQILCHNCNCAKGYYGYCPHQKAA